MLLWLDLVVPFQFLIQREVFLCPISYSLLATYYFTDLVPERRPLEAISFAICRSGNVAKDLAKLSDYRRNVRSADGISEARRCDEREQP